MELDAASFSTVLVIIATIIKNDSALARSHTSAKVSLPAMSINLNRLTLSVNFQNLTNSSVVTNLLILLKSTHSLLSYSVYKQTNRRPTLPKVKDIIISWIDQCTRSYRVVNIFSLICIFELQLECWQLTCQFPTWQSPIWSSSDRRNYETRASDLQM